MCLAIPEKIEKIDSENSKATVSGGREIDITLVPDAKVGDYLLIHANLAVQFMKEEEALETLKVASACEHGEHNDHKE